MSDSWRALFRGQGSWKPQGGKTWNERRAPIRYKKQVLAHRSRHVALNQWHPNQKFEESLVLIKYERIICGGIVRRLLEMLSRQWGLLGRLPCVSLPSIDSIWAIECISHSKWSQKPLTVCTERFVFAQGSVVCTQHNLIHVYVMMCHRWLTHRIRLY